MAKKKSKKKSMTSMIIAVVVIALAVLTICTMFMNVISVTGKVGLFGFGAETTTMIKGTDVFAAAFNGEVSSELTTATNLLVGLKSAEGTGFVTTIFVWGYILTIVVAIASLVFGILSLLGMKFNKVSVIVGAVLAVLALVTFVFAIIVAGKFSAETGLEGILSAGSKGAIAIGSCLLIATLIGGCSQAYNSRK